MSRWQYISSIWIAIAICSCGISEEEYNQLVIQEYERQMNIFIKEQNQICDREAEIEAEVIADSLISLMQINPLKDSLYRPFVPPKPDYISTDSTVVNSKQTVKPIID